MVMLEQNINQLQTRFGQWAITIYCKKIIIIYDVKNNTYRIISSKEFGAILINKSGHCISCNDVRFLGVHWANSNCNKKKIFNKIVKGHSKYFSLDSNDWCY